MIIKPIIQVAGILNLEEALMVTKSGATHLGFPFALDYHREDTTRQEAAFIISRLPESISPVLITYLNRAVEIDGLMRIMGCKTVQLHGPVETAEIRSLRKLFPDAEIWKSLIIRPGNPSSAIREMEVYQGIVDTFITDTFDTETGASGATGKTHDWKVSRKIAEQSQKPVVIAGGLNPGNICDAVLATRPAGVDVHTGVENTDGMKSRKLVRAFVENAKKAFQEIDQGK
jgi:phosphoribosylanthranilate isomerase